MEQVLLFYLKHVDSSASLEYIKLFAFEDLRREPVKGQYRGSLMRPDVGFVVGANGGAVVISLSSSSRCVTTTQKIYFCLIIKTLREILLIFFRENEDWEGRCKIVVDLLYKLSLDSVSADFFIYLLKV